MKYAIQEKSCGSFSHNCEGPHKIDLFGLCEMNNKCIFNKYNCIFFFNDNHDYTYDKQAIKVRLGETRQMKRWDIHRVADIYLN